MFFKQEMNNLDDLEQELLIEVIRKAVLSSTGRKKIWKISFNLVDDKSCLDL